MSSEPLSLTVLGCDGGYPGPGGACSGYLVRGGGTTLWLDAGPGTMANLQRHARLDQVDAIVLSHEHPDHWSDLEGFSVAKAFEIGGPPVPVYAPGGLRSHVYHDFGAALAWHEVAGGDTVEVGGLALRFSRTDHGPETLAVAVEGQEGSFGYSADSGPGWSLEDLGQGLDFVVCEATFTAEREGKEQHMSGRQAGRSARDARAGRLVLTHRRPGVDRATLQEEGSSAFGSLVTLAEIDSELVV